SDLLVFGRRAGLYAALYAKDFGGALTVDSGQIESIARTMLEPFSRSGGENPYAIQADLQQTMQDLVGLIRSENEVREAIKRIETYKERARRTHVDGGRTYNPGWHIALDLASLLTVAECCALAALERKESRGGHTRDDHPYTDDTWGKINVVIRERQGALALSREPLPEMPAELKALFQARKGWRPSRFACSVVTPPAAASRIIPSSPRRAWSSSTSSTRSRRPRPTTWRAGGTVRLASAGRAAPR